VRLVRGAGLGHLFLMRTVRWAWPLLGVLAGAAMAAEGDVDRILTNLADDAATNRAYGAIGARHFAASQRGFSLLSHHELRPWQQALSTGIPRLVDMLEDDRGLEWVDDNGASQTVTTPRKEAERALLALERASVEPLIAALDRPALAHKADDLLRRIVRGGPPGTGRGTWQQWWAAHRDRPLPNERGQLGVVILSVLGTAAAAGVVFWRQRAAKRSGLRP
jgi:hypothetical protein